MSKSPSNPVHAPNIPLSALEEAIGLSLAAAGEWHGRLTRREAEVAALMATGRPNRQIAEEMRISPKTLDFYRANVKAKLQAHTTAAVANLVNLLRLADGAVSASDDGQAAEAGGG
jgi:DNA-binding CsgD family transcriptional regulator